ncbi:MAG: prepilin-type cleavage/methylation domain-containing protein, partial [Planktothrix sp.]
MIRNHGKTGFLPSSESGYTILEGLMAVVVVAVLVSAIGPVIAFSVGTRAQARRVELATQAARSYIDWVKSPPDTTETETRHPKLTSNTAPSTGDLSGDCTTKDGYCIDKK